MPYPDLPRRVAEVRARIAERQALTGYTHPISIIAVTKTHPAAAVTAAVAAGIAAVGENRVQEALGKQNELPDLPVAWHLIGSLQRNKARQVAGRFALVHSIDNLALAQELDRRVAAGSRQPILLQVNCSGEAQKGGVEPEALPELMDQVARLERLELRGLMTMAEFTEDVAVQRSAFRRLRQVREAAEAGGIKLPELSMGMSGDYLAAVDEGTTMVRLGTLLFGERTT
jgi:hypothetical protein